MAESLYLEMPARKKSPAGGLFRRVRFVLFLAVAFVLLAALWWWLAGGRVDSVGPCWTAWSTRFRRNFQPGWKP